MKLTVIIPEYRIQVIYANNNVKMVDLYTPEGEFGRVPTGNTETKTAFETAVSNAGHNMDDYWAIQYSGGSHEIEFSNNSGNIVVSGNTGLSEYVSTLETWDATIQEEMRIASIPTWDGIRTTRDSLLLESDKIIAWSTETGNTVPSAWTTYRQDLRDITTTYGAPSGNTELVVWPTEPSWPTT